MIGKIFAAIMKVLAAATKFMVQAPVVVSAIFFTGLAVHGLYTGDMFQAFFGTICGLILWRYLL